MTPRIRIFRDLTTHRKSIVIDLANLVHHNHGVGFATPEQVEGMLNALLEGNDGWFAIEMQYRAIRQASEAATPHITPDQFFAVINKGAALAKLDEATKP